MPKLKALFLDHPRVHADPLPCNITAAKLYTMCAVWPILHRPGPRVALDGDGKRLTTKPSLRAKFCSPMARPVPGHHKKERDPFIECAHKTIPDANVSAKST